MNRSAASGVRLRRSWAAVLGDRAGKAAVDRAVQMAAEDALDLQMAGDDRSERLAVLQTGPVQALDAGREGWMVHHQQDRSRWRRQRNDRRRRWRMTLARNRKFADSPVEEDGFEPSVPRQISNGSGLCASPTRCSRSAPGSPSRILEWGRIRTQVRPRCWSYLHFGPPKKI